MFDEEWWATVAVWQRSDGTFNSLIRVSSTRERAEEIAERWAPRGPYAMRKDHGRDLRLHLVAIPAE